MSKFKLISLLLDTDFKYKMALVDIVTNTNTVLEYLSKIGLSIRNKGKNITLDMATNMELIVKRCFPKVHVQKLAIDALQDMRIAYSWKAMDE